MYAKLTQVLIFDALLMLFLVILPEIVCVLSLSIEASWANYAVNCVLFFAELYPVCSNAIAIIVITPYRRRVARALSHFRHSTIRVIPLNRVQTVRTREKQRSTRERC